MFEFCTGKDLRVGDVFISTINNEYLGLTDDEVPSLSGRWQVILRPADCHQFETQRSLAWDCQSMGGMRSTSFIPKIHPVVRVVPLSDEDLAASEDKLRSLCARY